MTKPSFFSLMRHNSGGDGIYISPITSRFRRLGYEGIDWDDMYMEISLRLWNVDLHSTLRLTKQEEISPETSSCLQI